MGIDTAMIYQTWCNQIRSLAPDIRGTRLESVNDVRVMKHDGEMILSKTISDTVVYIPRLKLLGEMAYALFDWHIDPEKRVTPNACAVSRNTIVRQFIEGWPGEVWRGELYRQKSNLESADLVIVDRILESPSAQRIALLDFIFLCQDRSARNWIEHDGVFYAIDNGMFWPWKNRYIDKKALYTGSVDHLKPPMEAIVSYDSQFSFRNGIFSSLYAGHGISDLLLKHLAEFDWSQYLADLAEIIKPLGYPLKLMIDWRFNQIGERAAWLLGKCRFPTAAETYNDDWQSLIIKPADGVEVWEREWERLP